MDDADKLKIIYYDQDYTQPVSVSGVSTAANPADIESNSWPSRIELL